MMSNNNTKSKKSKLPDVTSFNSPDAAGWLFRMIHDGWLSKKFRKRYCVLSGGMLYFYEFADTNGSEKACGSLDLKLYAKCTDAAKKEIKKNPTAFSLESKELAATTENNKSNKSNKKRVQRELFYTETEHSKTDWMTKINDAISLCAIGGETKKLDHITKTRAKPPSSGAGKRRPPTKNHLKERAKLSEINLDENIEPKSPKQKRGKQPTSAIKPPPLRKITNSSVTSSIDLPPPLPDSENLMEEPLPSPPPPPPPAKELKPKFSAEEIELTKSSSNASSYAASLASALSSSQSSSRSSSRGKADFENLPPPPSESDLYRCNSDKIPVLIVPLRDSGVNQQRMERAKSMVDVVEVEKNNNNNIKNGKVKKDKKKKEKKQKSDKKQNKKINTEIIV